MRYLLPILKSGASTIATCIQKETIQVYLSEYKIKSFNCESVLVVVLSRVCLAPQLGWLCRQPSVMLISCTARDKSAAWSCVRGENWIIECISHSIVCLFYKLLPDLWCWGSQLCLWVSHLSREVTLAVNVNKLWMWGLVGSVTCSFAYQSCLGWLPPTGIHVLLTLDGFRFFFLFFSFHRQAGVYWPHSHGWVRFGR